MTISIASKLLKQEKELAEKVVNRQYRAQPEIWKSFEDPLRAKSIRDVSYHLTYLIEALKVDDPLLFLDYLSWVKVLFAGLHFPPEVIFSTLEAIQEEIGKAFDKSEALPAFELISSGISHLTTAPDSIPSVLQGSSPLDLLAKEYLANLLKNDRSSASVLILDSIKNGLPIKDIYINVFQRTQHEVGRLWQMNQISVAQEHFCTAATQLIMSQLYPYLFGGERKQKKIVITCVGGELHEIGARMVADFFELGGWDTTYLGANTPTESIINMVDQVEANALALSTTITFHVSEVKNLIDRIHQTTSRPIPVLVGGFPFNISQELWRKVGADGFARDASEAVEIADGLM